MVYAGLCVVAYRKAEASKIAYPAEYTGLLWRVAIGGLNLFDEQPRSAAAAGACASPLLPLVAMARGKSISPQPAAV